MNYVVFAGGFICEFKVIKVHCSNQPWYKGNLQGVKFFQLEFETVCLSTHWVAWRKLYSSKPAYIWRLPNEIFRCFSNKMKSKQTKIWQKNSLLRFLGQFVAFFQLILAIQMDFWLIFSFWSSFETNFLYQNSARTKSRGFSASFGKNVPSEKTRRASSLFEINEWF